MSDNLVVLSSVQENPLLGLDVYKMGHMSQYVKKTSKVYSYLTARNGRTFSKLVMFGLTEKVKKYLCTPLTPEMGLEFLQAHRQIVGEPSEDVKNKIMELCNLGYIPLEIKSVEEGTVVPIKNVIMTITNTLPDFYWVVGFFESLILKLWYSITVATASYHYREVVDKYFGETVDEDFYFLKDYTVHDFGYRGDSSEEGAGISGVAHLLSFLGSDTVPALGVANRYYHGTSSPVVMASVPASEHSVMCSFGREDELSAFVNMLETYPEGIVSIVSDTFNVYTVLTDFAEKLKPMILSRNGKVVFRPDSGNPEYIICGDPSAPEGSNEWKGAIRLLDEKFGSTVNEKGYKVLNPKVGLIYGDGMYMERYIRTLERMKEMGYASSNLVIGVGGILRNHSRDTLGFAIKATYIEVDGEPREIEKDPYTDSSKKSHKGLLSLVWDDEHKFSTKDHCSKLEEQEGLLVPIFKNGMLIKDTTLEQMRSIVRKSLNDIPLD